MRTTVTALMTIVLVVIVVVGIYTATDSVLNSGNTEILSFVDFFGDCLGSGECELFGGEN